MIGRRWFSETHLLQTKEEPQLCHCYHLCHNSPPHRLLINAEFLHQLSSLVCKKSVSSSVLDFFDLQTISRSVLKLIKSLSSFLNIPINSSAPAHYYYYLVLYIDKPCLGHIYSNSHLLPVWCYERGPAGLFSESMRDKRLCGCGVAVVVSRKD